MEKRVTFNQLRRVWAVFGFLLFFAWSANADLYFKTYIDPGFALGESSIWEADAVGYANIRWSLTPPREVFGVDAYVRYSSNNRFVIEDNANPVYGSTFFGSIIGLGEQTGFTDTKASDFTFTNINALETAQLTKQVPSGVNSWNAADNDYGVYTLALQVLSIPTLGLTTLSFDPDFAKVSDTTQNPVDSATLRPIDVNITAAEPPLNFSGPTSAADHETGNTVTINWTDLNAANNGLKAGGTSGDDTPPIKYDVYLNRDNTFDLNSATEDNLISFANAQNLPGSAVTFGGNGVPGTPPLSDTRTYYFRMRAKDSTTKPNELGKHKTIDRDAGSYIVSVMPHDFTPPAAPTGPDAITGKDNVKNNYLRATWTNPADADFADGGGIAVLKKIGGDSSGAPDLGKASGTSHGPTYKEGDKVGDWTVYKLFNSSTNAFEENESAVQNGTRYHYAIYAYDKASDGNPTDNDTYQQGRNYSPAKVISGTPGVEPSRVQNFVALTGPVSPVPALTLNWTNSPEDYYGGALVLATLDVAVLEAMTPTSHLAEPVEGEVTPNKTNVFLVGRYALSPDTAPNNSVEIAQLNGQPIDPEKPYYFKNFAYNAGTEVEWDASNLEALNSHLYSAGEIAGDRILPSGSGGVGGIYTYNLKPYSPSLLAINSLTTPAVENLAATVVLGGNTLPTIVKPAVSTASQLIGLINEAAGRPVVNVLSKWDPSSGKGVGLTYNTVSSSFTGEDFQLKAGEGYQIYVTDEMTLVLEARREAQ